ncbi:hypothetical protein B9Z55_002021 [Caenorhabditis nigoni]|uniref:Uncharacterized protein n=1 Tax=Caenorhabditis nigoni TaxID=1611254 RepID=A0A2G5VIQ3_9PELO|nr:hypothetical protein B9Z55_002021 [Caenorhabditis nigoni]
MIGADGGGIGGSELMEVESEYRNWCRWNRRIGANCGGIGAGRGGIGAGRGGIGADEGGIGADEGGIGADRGGIEGSELVEGIGGSELMRWNQSIGADGGVVRGCELVEVESEDRNWWMWNRRIGFY